MASLSVHFEVTFTRKGGHQGPHTWRAETCCGTPVASSDQADPFAALEDLRQVLMGSLRGMDVQLHVRPLLAREER